MYVSELHSIESMVVFSEICCGIGYSVELAIRGSSIDYCLRRDMETTLAAVAAGRTHSA